MLKRKLIILFVMLGFIVFCNVASSYGGGISGRVTNTAGLGLQDIYVDIYDTNYNFIGSTSTEANGNYSLQGLITRYYYVYFSGYHVHYLDEWYDNKESEWDADAVYVNAPNTTAGIDAVLTQVGGISGRVSDVNNAGIQGIEVHLYDTNYDWIASETTGIDGNYSFDTIPSGNYKVQFSGYQLGYIDEWFDNAAYFEDAEPIPVAAPYITTGIDAVLEMSGSISGRVTDNTGTGIKNVLVSVCDANDQYSDILGASTDINGFYTVQGIPSGNYKIHFSTYNLGYLNEWFNDKTAFTSADVVSVAAPNVTTGIDAVLIKGGSISGRVTDVNGTGIQNVYVSVRDAGDEYSYVSSSSTDANGNYTIKSIPSGDYKIYFSTYNLGYLNEWFTDKTAFTSADVVSVTAPNETSGIDAILIKGGSISGRVTDGSGGGIQNVVVRIYDINYQYITYIYTDVSGNYSVKGIPSGNYLVSFDGRPLNYLNESYNDKQSFCNADIISVNAPDTTMGIDAILAVGGVISGKVSDVNGTGIPDVSINVYDLEMNNIEYGYTDEFGNYTIQGVLTGDYKIQFSGAEAGYVNKWYNDASDFCNAHTVTVLENHTTSGINVALERGGSISGKILNISGTGIDNILVEVNDVLGYPVSSSYTDADGNYSVMGIPTGLYKVFFIGWDPGYFTEWYNDQEDFSSAHTITVTAPLATTGINAVLGQGDISETGSITGRVTDTYGTGLKNVWVSVHDLNNEYIYISSAQTDKNGLYSIQNIPTGNYKISFSGSNIGYINEWFNDKSGFTNANVVPVTTANTTIGIDAVLDLGGSISGEVTDALGLGIQDLNVRVQDTNGNWILYGWTAGCGNYKVIGIPTGNHKVMFGGSSNGYLDEWYDNKADSNSADLVAVAAPDMTSGINASLNLGGSISGRIIDEGGWGIKGVQPYLYDSNQKLMRSTRTDACGNYVFRGLSTGDYKIRFYGSLAGYADEWYNNKLNFTTADTISVVAPGNVLHIDTVLSVAPTGSISGKVSNNTGSGIQNIKVDVFNTNRMRISGGVTDINGNHVISGIPIGNYKILFNGQSVGYLDEWYNDKADFVAANTVSVTASNTTSGINAILARGGSISGRVTDINGSGVQNVIINVYDGNYNVIASANSDLTGNYIVEGPSTGSYRIEYKGGGAGCLDEWYNDKADYASADLVSVTAPNATAGINAVLAYGGGVLEVVPNDNLVSYGYQGGPFSSISIVYTVRNKGSHPVSWQVNKSREWTNLSQTSGTLSSGESVFVVVSINTNANSLPPGSYSDLVSFINTTNGIGNTTRTVSLNIMSPSILTISPNKGGNAGSVTVTITSSGLQEGATVKLVKGVIEIIGTNTQLISVGKITATFDLTGLSVGLWGLVITNPDNSQVSCENCFIVEEGGEAKLWVEIVGRNQVRLGRSEKYTIRYGNSGLINAKSAEVVLWFPTFLKAELTNVTGNLGATLDKSMLPSDYDLDVMGFMVIFDSISPGESGVLYLSITNQDNLSTFDINARMNQNFGTNISSYVVPENKLGTSLFMKSGDSDLATETSQQDGKYDVEGMIVCCQSNFGHSVEHFVLLLPIIDNEGNVAGKECWSEKDSTGELFSTVGQIDDPHVCDSIIWDVLKDMKTCWPMDKGKVSLGAEDINTVSSILIETQGGKPFKHVEQPFKNPDKNEFDCIGIFEHAFEQAGINNNEGLIPPHKEQTIYEGDNVRDAFNMSNNCPKPITQRGTGGKLINPDNGIQVETVTAIDPNDKSGHVGFDLEGTSEAQRKKFIASDHSLGYMVFFENLETATAAAQEVLITDQLDANLDWATFSFGTMQIGEKIIFVPEGLKNFQTTVDLRPDMPSLVDVDCNFQLSTGKFGCLFRGKDPDTGELADFLPPNTDAVDPKGRGWISFSVMPKPNLSTGTVIKNKATIDFEVGIPPAPMDTPEVFNTIDSGIPMSSVSPLASEQTTTDFTVSWNGSDDAGGSGIKNFDIYVSDNGNPYSLWMTTPDTSATFTGENGHQYSFYIRARDNVGNLEDAPTQPDAKTTVEVSCGWLGDLNHDGEVDISDVILELRIALCLDFCGEPTPPCSDMNGDGQVDISDVILVLRVALGLDPKKPCTVC